MGYAVKSAFIFTIGAAIGSAVTWKLLKTRYEQRTQAEIDSVKEVYSRRRAENADAVEEIDQDMDDDAESEEYTEQVRENNYINYSEMYVNTESKKKKPTARPYVIAPENFGELDNYEKVSLTYYDDKVLVDEDDELVEDVDDVVGLDSLRHFGEYEDDSVFVRNDRLKCDYEILLDQRKYSDVIEKKPHLMED